MADDKLFSAIMIVTSKHNFRENFNFKLHNPSTCYRHLLHDVRIYTHR